MCTRRCGTNCATNATHGSQIGMLIETCDGLRQAIKTMAARKVNDSPVLVTWGGPVARSATARATKEIGHRRGSRIGSNGGGSKRPTCRSSMRKKGLNSRTGGDEFQDRYVFYMNRMQLNVSTAEHQFRLFYLNLMHVTQVVLTRLFMPVFIYCMRKLDLGDEDGDSEEFSDVAQDTLGSPFTYGTHNKCHLEAEMSWNLLRLLTIFAMIWRSSKSFCSSAYVLMVYFVREDLVHDEYPTRTQKTLHSLVPGEVVRSEVIDLVVGKLAHDKDNSAGSHQPFFRKRYMGKYEDAYFFETVLNDRRFYEITYTEKNDNLQV
ncbi:hypothetical protein PIB30_101340 [Stylosanthes scabra]|uniref:Anoctamin n=1 Tax=Stylosanthes scabra TaxID=79078 RepID=A0ABU6ZW02_9FABA|nr:hypothetical protein [Stylosanthes scabra]